MFPDIRDEGDQQATAFQKRMTDASGKYDLMYYIKGNVILKFGGIDNFGLV